MIGRLNFYNMILFIFFSPVYAASHHPQEFLQSIKGSKNEGKQIYNHYCANCHAQKPLISIGAPKIHDEKEWSVRLKQGISVLFKHTNEGLNAMPPRGGCFECTDRQLMLAIEHIVLNKGNKSILNDLKGHKKIK